MLPDCVVIMQRLVLGVVKRNPLFLHEIEWKNNGFLFTIPNIKKNFGLILYLKDNVNMD